MKTLALILVMIAVPLSVEAHDYFSEKISFCECNPSTATCPPCEHKCPLGFEFDIDACVQTKSKRQELIEKCDWWLDRLEGYKSSLPDVKAKYAQIAQAYCLRASLEK